MNNPPSNRINVPIVHLSSRTTILKHSPSMITQIKHRWIHLLLNNRLSKGQDDRQLSSVVHQSSTPSIAARDTVSSGKSCNPPRTIVQRRPRCTTFAEHLQRYNRSPLCLTFTRTFHHQPSNQPVLSQRNRKPSWNNSCICMSSVAKEFSNLYL